MFNGNSAANALAVNRVTSAFGTYAVGSLGDRCHVGMTSWPNGRPHAFVRTNTLMCEPALMRFSPKKVTYSDFRAEMAANSGAEEVEFLAL